MTLQHLLIQAYTPLYGSARDELNGAAMKAEEARKAADNVVEKFYPRILRNIQEAANQEKFSTSYEVDNKRSFEMLIKKLKKDGYKINLAGGFGPYAFVISWSK